MLYSIHSDTKWVDFADMVENKLRQDMVIIIMNYIVVEELCRVVLNYVYFMQ